MNFPGFVAISALSILPLTAHAVPVVYTVTTYGEVSSLGAIVGSSAPITFVGTADTANLQELREVPTTGSHGSRIYVNTDVIPLTSLVVTIGNSLPAKFLTTPSLSYSYADVVEFTDSSSRSYLGYNVPTLPTSPDVLASFTSIPIVFQNYAFVGQALTDLGTLTVAGSPGGYHTFLSVTPGMLVPEPNSFVLVAAGLVGLLCASRKPRLLSMRAGPRMTASHYT